MDAMALAHQQECDRLDQLSREVALELIRVTGTGVNGGVDCFLQRLVEEVDADRGTLIAASDRAETIEAAYGWARRPIADSDLATDAPRLKWFLEQLALDGGDVLVFDASSSPVRPERAQRCPVRDRGSRLRPRPPHVHADTGSGARASSVAGGDGRPCSLPRTDARRRRASRESAMRTARQQCPSTARRRPPSRDGTAADGTRAPL